MTPYLNRCWNIINGKAKKEALTKTIVHSCLGHFSKSVKRQAAKYYTKQKLRTRSIMFYKYSNLF